MQIWATLELMDASVESIGPARGGYNVSGVSFTAGELADAISERVDGFTCEFKPDERQQYADSWPDRSTTRGLKRTGDGRRSTTWARWSTRCWTG
ncbi:MAG: hypothetical protein CM1200mP32_04010 [Methanobacteriota archaeon]|nr:MAG: hypothetical protein CM1200mP32_04010 [Euryarchaeota archaeon]